MRLLTVATAAVAVWLLLPLAGKTAPAHRPSPAVERAIRHASKVYGAPYREMLAVSWCESRWNPRAVGNGSHGLFQFLRGTWSRTPFARKNIYSAWWNAHAAAWLWLHDGRSWREWACRPR